MNYLSGALSARGGQTGRIEQPDLHQDASVIPVDVVMRNLPLPEFADDNDPVGGTPGSGRSITVAWLKLITSSLTGSFGLLPISAMSPTLRSPGYRSVTG
jgi:hypothetical protein